MVAGNTAVAVLQRSSIGPSWTEWLNEPLEMKNSHERETWTTDHQTTPREHSGSGSNVQSILLMLLEREDRSDRASARTGVPVP